LRCCRAGCLLRSSKLEPLPGVSQPLLIAVGSQPGGRPAAGRTRDACDSDPVAARPGRSVGLGAWTSLGACWHGGWSAGHRERGRRDRAALAARGLEGVFSSRVVGASKPARHRKRGRNLAAGGGLGGCQHLHPEGDVDLFGGSEPAAGEGDPRARWSAVRGDGARSLGRAGHDGGRGSGRLSG
jgi:hypothetical protein